MGYPPATSKIIRILSGEFLFLAGMHFKHSKKSTSNKNVNIGAPQGKREPNNGASDWEMQQKCHHALMAHGIDTRVWRLQRDASGGVSSRPSMLTRVVNGTHETHTFAEFKPTWRMPFGEHKAREAIRKDLIYFLKTHRHVWSGVVTFGKRCTLKKASHLFKEALTSVRQHFENVERHNQIKHIFSITEHNVRDPKTQRLVKDRKGRLLYHVHVHFLILCSDRQDPTQSRWYEAFKKRFGKGSDIQRIRCKGALTTYLLKALERADLVENGEFPEWFQKVAKAKRMGIYGPLKQCRKWREAVGRKVVELPGCPRRLGIRKFERKPVRRHRRAQYLTPVAVPVDQHVTKAPSRDAQKNRIWVDYFRNVHGPAENLHSRTRVPDYGRPGFASPQQFSNIHVQIRHCLLGPSHFSDCLSEG